MGARRKPKAEVELVQALCNSDECTRLSQINLALIDKNTKLIQVDIERSKQVEELEKDLSRTQSMYNELSNTKIELEEQFRRSCQQQAVIEEAYDQRTKELDKLQRTWYVRLFS